jgi:hypothetical protein
MTNAQKYLKDGIDIEELSNDIESYIKFYGGFDTKEFFEDESWCSQSKKARPVLTDDERAILRHLKDFYYIYRTTTGKLEATNHEHTWCGYELYLDDDVFQFIKPRRRIFY